jgi:hypothetical protein
MTGPQRQLLEDALERGEVHSNHLYGLGEITTTSPYYKGGKPDWEASDNAIGTYSQPGINHEGRISINPDGGFNQSTILHELGHHVHLSGKKSWTQGTKIITKKQRRAVRKMHRSMRATLKDRFHINPNRESSWTSSARRWARDKGYRPYSFKNEREFFADTYKLSRAQAARDPYWDWNHDPGWYADEFLSEETDFTLQEVFTVEQV